MVDRYLCARLTGDPTVSRFGREVHRPGKDGDYPEKALRWWDIAEVFWRCADLTGQDLTIAHPARGEMSRNDTNLAWVRLVPMDDAAIKRWKAERPTPDTKLLMANYDGGNFTQWAPLSHEDYLAEFECLRDTDFDIALYAVAGGPITRYPTKVAEFIRPEKGLVDQGPIIHEIVSKGVDPLAAAIEAAHECGVKLFPQNRLGGSALPPKNILADYGGKLMEDHPEWMCVYADGEKTRHLSFAFEGVRDFYVRMLREWVEDYRADGVNILFSRSQPFVYYEQPVCEAFEAEHGEDMRKLPVGDERVMRARARFMTQFLREVRAMLDEVGKAQDRYIPNCYNVPVHNSPSNIGQWAETGLGESLFNALDVPAWIAEGLVDYLVVHVHMYGEHDGKAVRPKVREFTELAKGTRTKVFVDIYPRRMPPRQYRKIAMSYYEAGADGLAFWDSFGRYYRSSEWAFVKRLGHRENLASWEGKGDDYYRVVPLRRLDGYVMEREFSAPSDG
jgi:hypothetical protein